MDVLLANDGATGPDGQAPRDRDRWRDPPVRGDLRHPHGAAHTREDTRRVLATITGLRDLGQNVTSP